MVELTENNTSRSIEVDGMKISYHEAGEGDPVIFLHSYNVGTSAWLNYHKNLPFLSQHFRCIAMDLVNFGRTGPLVYHEPGHHVHARTALKLMDGLGIDKAHFVGNSNGGTTCLVFALAHPERIDKIVMGGSHASTGGDPYLIANRPSEGSKMNRETHQNPTRENIRRNMLVHLNNHELVTDQLVEYMYENANSRPDHREARLASTTVPHSNLADLPNIKSPVLIVHGRYDRMVPVEVGLAVMNYLTDSRLVIFNNCGHWPPYEFPEDYNRQVLNFLKGTGA
jgi:2-hydroxy-6-oxonona-2,4-dienedioate hydrolase